MMDEIQESESFLRHYNPADISNWVNDTAIGVIRGLASEIRTRIPISIWLEIKLQNHFDHLSSLQNSEIITDLDRLNLILTLESHNINKIAAEGARYALFKERNNVFDVPYFDVAHYDLDLRLEPTDENHTEKWRTIHPLSMLSAVSNGIVDKATIMQMNARQSLEISLGTTGIEKYMKWGKGTKSMEEVLKYLIHEALMLERVGRTGLAYIEHKIKS